MTRSPLLALLVSTTSFLAVTSAPAFAQTDTAPEVQHDTIISTGTRQAYQGDFTTLETPQAELTIDSEILRNVGAVDLNQALDLSASTARQNNFGGLWNSFALRGFVGDENLPSNYLVNGFNAGRGFGGPRDLSSIESVEVLKGPRAALFGRGEPGGTVNLVTKRPTFETEGEFRLSLGSFETYRADIDWTSPVSDNTAVRLVGFYEDAESFRDTIETTKYGFSPSVAFKLGEATQLVYEMEYSKQEIPFDRGVLAIDGELGIIPQSRFLGEPGDGPIEAEVLGHQVELQHEFNDNWSALIGLNYRDTSLEGFSTEAELSGSRQLLYTDGETLTRQRRFRDYDAVYKVLRGEITGNFSTGNFEHNVLIGADVDQFENDQIYTRARAPSLSTDPSLEQLQAINIFNPVYGQYTVGDMSLIVDRVEKQNSSGLFIQDQVSLTDRLDVRVGLRYDDYAQKLHNRTNDSISKLTESRVSPQFGAVYKMSDTVSLYAAYGENFRPLSGTDANGDGFDPNQSTSTEAGVKFSLLDGALGGVFTVFQVQQDNMLVVDDPDAFTYAAIGEAESQGIEFDLNGQITPTLSLWASYAYVDASTKNAFYDANFGTLIAAGSPLLNIPEHSLNIQLAKDVTLAGREASFGGGLLYVSERSGEFTSDFKLPEYTIAKAFAAYNITEAVTVRAEVDNLFDKTYYSNSFSQLWVQPGTPRNFRVSAALRF